MYCVKGQWEGDLEVYIDSLRRKMEPKSLMKHGRNAYNRLPHLSFEHTIGKILRRYHTVSTPDEDSQLPSSTSQLCLGLPPISHKKRWSEIGKEEEESIRHYIAQKKADSSSTQLPQKQLPKRYKQPTLSISQKSNARRQLLLEKVKYGGTWMEHIRNFNSQNSSKNDSIVRSGYGYLFPELLAKLPKVSPEQPEQSLVLAKSMEIKLSDKDDIFCSRKIKRSQVKLKVQKKAEHAERRKKLYTPNHAGVLEPALTPWNHSTRPLFS